MLLVPWVLLKRYHRRMIGCRSAPFANSPALLRRHAHWRGYVLRLTLSLKVTTPVFSRSAGFVNGTCVTTFGLSTTGRSVNKLKFFGSPLRALRLLARQCAQGIAAPLNTDFPDQKMSAQIISGKAVSA